MSKIFWNSPKFGNKELALVKEVLDAGYVSEGPKTKELEEKLAKIIGCKHVIMTTSCTAALYLALEADKQIRGYSYGEVIIPDLTFVATKNAVEFAGLMERCIDTNVPFKVNNAKALIQVNILGRDTSNGIDIEELVNNEITLICDNAGALGSDVPIGKVGCYSLQGNKIVSCGQGGFCATNDDEYSKVIREQKDFGRNMKEDNDTTGFNFKFNDILAAVTLGQLEQLEHRKHLLQFQYAMYRHKLEKYGKFIDFKPTEIPLWIEFGCKNKKERDDLYKHLKVNDINCRFPWISITKLPNSFNYSETFIWLPNGPTFTVEEQNEVIKHIVGFYETR